MQERQRSLSLIRSRQPGAKDDPMKLKVVSALAVSMLVWVLDGHAGVAGTSPAHSLDEKTCAATTATRPLLPNMNNIVVFGAMLARNPAYQGADPSRPIKNFRPSVRLTIDRQGRVIRSEMEAGTGSPAMDGEILKWANRITFGSPSCTTAPSWQAVLPIELANFVGAAPPAAPAVPPAVPPMAEDSASAYAQACGSYLAKRTLDAYFSVGGPGISTTSTPVVTLRLVVDRTGKIVDATVMKRFDTSLYHEYALEAVQRVGTCGTPPPPSLDAMPVGIVVSFGAGWEDGMVLDARGR
jgi:hypothetical protein